MVTVVVVINTLISLLLLYIARQIWQIKRRLGFIADRLTAYEKSSHAALSPAPQNLEKSQQNIHNLRLRNESLQFKLQQVQQIVNLLLLAQRMGQRYFRLSNLFWQGAKK